MPKTETKKPEAKKVEPKNKASTKKVVKKKKKPKYSLSVTVNDREFKTDADNLTDALTKFVESDKFPIGVKTTTFLKYSKGKKEGSQIWHVPRARRTFRLISLKRNSLTLLANKLETKLR